MRRTIHRFPGIYNWRCLGEVSVAMLMNKRLCVNTGIFQLLLLSPASILGIGKLIALTQGIVIPVIS